MHASSDLRPALTGPSLLRRAPRGTGEQVTPQVQARMLAAYEHCAAERGSGCYMRMKEYMKAHAQRVMVAGRGGAATLSSTGP